MIVDNVENRDMSVGVLSHHDFIWEFTRYIKQGVFFGISLENADRTAVIISR